MAVTVRWGFDMFEPVELKGSKVLLTGPTGQVAEPIVTAYAPLCELHALARFSDPAVEQQLKSQGVHTHKIDLADGDLSSLPDDFDYVINLAVVKSGDFDYDLRANGEGAGRLMLHCRNVKAFMHCSSTAVYEYAGHEARKEDAPLGDNHRAMFPTYSIAKIAAETVVRFTARQFGIPTTIARLSVPYGDNGGWPYWHTMMMQNSIPIDVHPEKPNLYNPLHADDYIEKIPRLLAAATPDVRTLNFGGSQAVAIEEWCEYISELTGLQPSYKESSTAFGSLQIDTEAMHAAIGPTRVDWKDGIKSMLQHMAPELLK